MIPGTINRMYPIDVKIFISMYPKIIVGHFSFRLGSVSLNDSNFPVLIKLSIYL